MFFAAINANPKIKAQIHIVAPDKEPMTRPISPSIAPVLREVMVVTTSGAPLARARKVAPAIAGDNFNSPLTVVRDGTSQISAELDNKIKNRTNRITNAVKIMLRWRNPVSPTKQYVSSR